MFVVAHLSIYEPQHLNRLVRSDCSGLGECQLSLAKSLMEDCRDGGAIDLIQQAIKNLFR